MPTISLADRHQLTFMNSLDDAVCPEHPVRLLDALIDRIISQDPDYFDHLSPNGADGRPGYPASVMIKLYMYGYINGITTCRKLQNECQRNVEVMWLIQKAQPCFKTIANYARNYSEQLTRVNEQIVRFMFDHNHIKGQRVACDGSKLKAYTGWTMYSRQSLDKQLQKAHHLLNEWVDNLLAQDDLFEDEQADAGLDEHTGTSAPGESPGQVMERIEQLHAKIEELQALKEQLEAQQCTRISPADPQARVMRTAQQTSIPGYNLQIAVDEDSKMVIVSRLTQAATDFEQLLPNYQAVVSRLGMAPEIWLADTGYADLGDIKHIESTTPTTCYIPENDTPVTNREITFDYQPETNEYRCSEGKPLVSTGKPKYCKTKQAYVETFKGTECGGCPRLSKCTSSKSGIRKKKVFHGAKWRHKYAKRLKSTKAKALIRQRCGWVEHPFGTLKYWMGHIPLKHRGLAHCQTQIDIYSSAYNIKRWLNLDHFKNLMKQVHTWKPQTTAMAG